MSKKDVLIIDNYDSFSYNLKHLAESVLNYDVGLMKNDQLDHKLIDQAEYLILSPGPGVPKEAGQLMELIENYYDKKKILGVCLGLQAIAEWFDAKLINLDQVFHGIKSDIIRCGNDSILFNSIPSRFEAGRYHSWVVDPTTLSNEFIITAYDEDQNIMGFEHESLPIYAVQFHPESILTLQGEQIMRNFLCS